MDDTTGGARHARPDTDGTDQGSSTPRRDNDRGQTGEPGTPGEAPGGFTLRSGDEIIERFWLAGDPFSWERETLLPYLTRTEADFLNDVEWAAVPHRPRTIDAVVHDAHVYLDYTWGLILRHRFVPSQRSMFKIDYWMWLLGHDRLAFTTDDFDARRPLCMPQLSAAAQRLGAWTPQARRNGINVPPIPLTDDQRARLERMAVGEPCIPDCADCLS